jgi:hypothetical protein
VNSMDLLVRMSIWICDNRPLYLAFRRTRQLETVELLRGMYFCGFSVCAMIFNFVNPKWEVISEILSFVWLSLSSGVWLDSSCI